MLSLSANQTCSMLLQENTILTETKSLSPVYAQGCTTICSTHAPSVSLMASHLLTNSLTDFPVQNSRLICLYFHWDVWSGFQLSTGLKWDHSDALFSQLSTGVHKIPGRQSSGCQPGLREKPRGLVPWRRAIRALN